MLAPNVKAEENVLTCSKTRNLFDGKFISGGYTSVGTTATNFDDSVTYRVTSSSFIKVIPKQTYYFSMSYSSGQTYFLYFDENFSSIGVLIEPRTPSSFSAIIPDGVSYLRIMIHSYALNNSFWPSYENGSGWAQLENSDSKTDFVAFEECSTTPEEPDTPDPPLADATLDNFYSIYLSKLSSLATFATENKIFFSAIAILLTFAIFELFFMLFRGRRKTR